MFTDRFPLSIHILLDRGCLPDLVVILSYIEVRALIERMLNHEFVVLALLGLKRGRLGIVGKCT